MAYMSQETKKQLSPAIKAVLKQYGMKGSISVDHHSSLVVNIKSGPLDILNDTMECQIRGSWKNPYWQEGDAKTELKNISISHHNIEEQHTGTCLDFLISLRDAMMNGNHDNSDIMTDYFDVGWYIQINIGRWDKPYLFTP